MKLIMENWKRFLNESEAPLTFEFFEKLIDLSADEPQKYHMTPERLRTIMRYMSILQPGEAEWLLNLIRDDQRDDGVAEEDLLDVNIFDRTKEGPKKRHLPFIDDEPEEPPKKHYPWDD